MQTQMTKSQLIAKISELRELAKKDVKAMMEALAEVGYKELKKNGVFVVPGFAKFIVVKKPATKARKGTNPFTGEVMRYGPGEYPDLGPEWSRKAASFMCAQP